MEELKDGQDSGEIFPVMGVRRVAIYVVSMALMICWMKGRSRNRVSK